MTGVCYGQSDVPLLLGAEPAASELAERVAKLATSAPLEVWTSPWARCREVAEELGRIWRAPVSVDARLSELSFGAWEGRSYAELEQDPAFQHWMRNYETARAPGGECLTELMTRAAAWVDERLHHGASERILVVTHAGIIRSLRAQARGVSFSVTLGEAVPYLTPEPWHPA